jgi:flagellar assembly protein FliH
LSESAAIRKYGFETEFAPTGEILRDGSARARLLGPEEVEAERVAAYEKGKDDATAQAEREAAAALADLTKAANAIIGRLDGEIGAMRAEAARVALAAARKIAAEALDAFGVERAAAAVEAAMDSLRHQPRLIVKLAPALAEKLRARIEEIGQTHAYAGAVLVRDDPGANSGRISIDWSDGVIALDAAEIAQRIETLIEESLVAAAAGQ